MNGTAVTSGGAGTEIARDVVDRELERLLGRELTRPLEVAVSMDLTTSAAAAWMHTLELVEREASRPNGLTRFPLAAAYLENLIIRRCMCRAC